MCFCFWLLKQLMDLPFSAPPASSQCLDAAVAPPEPAWCLGALEHPELVILAKNSC